MAQVPRHTSSGCWGADMLSSSARRHGFAVHGVPAPEGMTGLCYLPAGFTADQHPARAAASAVRPPRAARPCSRVTAAPDREELPGADRSANGPSAPAPRGDSGCRPGRAGPRHRSARARAGGSAARAASSCCWRGSRWSRPTAACRRSRRRAPWVSVGSTARRGLQRTRASRDFRGEEKTSYAR